MKGGISAFINTNGGLIRSIAILYHNLIASDFVRKVIETLATRILIIGIGLVSGIIVTRILGPDGKGLYAIAGIVGAIGVQFGNLGLHASNTYVVAKKRELLPMLAANSLFISFIVGGLTVLTAWAIFSLWPAFAPVHGLLLVLGLLWIPFGLAYLLLQNLLLGIQEIRSYNKIELISNMFSVILIVLLIIFKLVTVEAVFSVGLLILILNIVWVFLRLYPHFTSPLKLSFTLFRTNIIYGLKAYLAAFFAFLVLRIDLLMVKYMLGEEQAGYYSLAVNMVDMIYLLPVVVGTILFPKLSAINDIQEKLKLVKQVTLGIGFIMAIWVTIAALLAEPITLLLYGEAFMPAVPAFIWLLPGIFFLGVQVVIVQLLNSIGFPRSIVLIWGFSSLINVTLNIWAIPRYGISGASIASSTSYLIVLIFILCIIQGVIKNHEHFNN